MRIVLDLQGAQSGSRFRGIGRYTLALAQAITRQAGQHQVWLALSTRFPDSIEPICAAFADLIPAERIRLFEAPGPVAEVDLANTWRMQAAELLREKFLLDLRPDIVHVSTMIEGAGNEVVASCGRFSPAVPTSATLYDLIPLFRPESYLKNPAVTRSYLRHAQSLKQADLLLAISESCRQEAIEALHIPADRITTIGAGVHQWFQEGKPSAEGRAKLMARYGLQRPFVLYASAIEPRKNVEGLINAFALLPQGVRLAHQLALVGELRGDDRSRLAAVAAEHGLDANEMVCLDYVPDEDLRLLYGTCSVFVFPSLHEGFGLPVLEAMVCGAPVIGSNCTSIPEIINREDALFDPYQPRDIASRMAEVLSNTELRQNLKDWGRKRAKAFTWEASARKALNAFETLHTERKAAQMVKPRPTTQYRPLLAFVAPLPPHRSGIAGYSARLLPSLARHYEIVCIVDQPEVSDPRVTAEFTIRDVRWFEANAGRFERILYQFGNSHLHKHMFRLLERHPGVVVLHDFYLSGALNWMEGFAYAPGSYTEALYDSHGFSALEYDRSNGYRASVAAFPCNAAVLRGSIGVIVHSNHSIEMARTWYGDRMAATMRQAPFLPFAPGAIERKPARLRLGFSERAFVVCSFGFVAPTKLSDRLLEAWLGSPLAEDETCFLIFVGENESGDYGHQFLDRIARSACKRIRITGYVNDPQYRDYLAAADLAVQLRTGSRGETSATVFDCLARRVPLIVNAHGSAAELPDDAAMKLDDTFTDQALSAALIRLHEDTGLREKLGVRGVLYLDEVHHPERVAQLYRDIIEDFYTTSSQAQEQQLVRAIARISAPAGPSESDLAAVATALTANRDRFGLPQILIDVTNVAKSDLRTGIERVTRGILMALIADPPPGYRIEPARASGDGYVYARRFTCQALGLPGNALTDDPVEAGHGDIFIGLDWCADVVPNVVPWLEKQKWRGVRLVFAIYDVLPLLQPQMFPPEMEPIVRRWLDALTTIADGLVCISRNVADEVLMCLDNARRREHRLLPVGFFHLGADLHASLPIGGLPKSSANILASIRSRPSFLMVGTVEPRKGHRQALAAMERLWADGLDANLVIIGKKGWMIDDLAERVRHHPERNHRLFWLQGVSDEMLDQVYRSAHALLAASVGEGFGLPLIEAAQHGLPVIARDIPVFREVAGEHAYYFRGDDPQALADALRAWLSLGDAVPGSTEIPWLTWQQSSRQLLEVVLADRWYQSWPHSATVPRLPTVAGSLEPAN